MLTSWIKPSRRAALSVLLTVLVALPLAGLTGCGDTPDQKEIRANWERYERSMRQRGGLDYYDLISKGTAEYYDRLVKLAIKGSKADVAALAPVEKGELIMMRNRVPFAKLKTMDGRAYILHAISERYWLDGESDDEVDPLWEHAKITVSGNVAIADWVVTMQVEEAPRLSRRRMSFGGTRNVVVDAGQMYFIKEDGAWRIDELVSQPATNKLLNSGAAGTTIEKFLIEVEEEETGKPVHPDIFDKPPR